jgi:hypothetical protein
LPLGSLFGSFISFSTGSKGTSLFTIFKHCFSTRWFHVIHNNIENNTSFIDFVTLVMQFLIGRVIPWLDVHPSWNLFWLSDWNDIHSNSFILRTNNFRHHDKMG